LGGLRTVGHGAWQKAPKGEEEAKTGVTNGLPKIPNGPWWNINHWN